jgi:hypothetical protein
MKQCLVALLLVGCGVHMQMTPLVGFDPKRAPTCWQGVQVFTSPDQVGAPFTPLAYLHATSEVSVSDEKVVRNLRERAATIGGNGLLLVGVNTETGARSSNTSGTARPCGYRGTRPPRWRNVPGAIGPHHEAPPIVKAPVSSDTLSFALRFDCDLDARFRDAK